MKKILIVTCSILGSLFLYLIFKFLGEDITEFIRCLKIFLIICSAILLSIFLMKQSDKYLILSTILVALILICSLMITFLI